MEHIQLRMAVVAAFFASSVSQEFYDKFHFRIIIKYPSGSDGAVIGGVNQSQCVCQSAWILVDEHEIGLKDHRIHDIGALKHDNTTFHKTSKEELFIFLNDVDYICGHNIVHHDAKYLFTDKICRWILVDTLYVSPLLFPEHPYHRLVKDDKLMSEQMNNPVNDCKKAKDLLLDEIACWHSLPKEKRRGLLYHGFYGLSSLFQHLLWHNCGHYMVQRWFYCR